MKPVMIFTAGALAVALGACGEMASAPQTEAPQPPAYEAGLTTPAFALVSEVLDVTVTPEGDGVRVVARGQVPSGGWSKPRLDRGEGASADIIDLEFRAMPPEGPATMALAGIEAFGVFVPPPGATAVRVIGANNEMVVALP